MSLMSARTIDKMREVMMDPEGNGPEEVYFMIRGKPNITIWEAGRIGREYTKTYGHYHLHEQPETYWIRHGESLWILQKMGEKPDIVEKIKIIYAKTGDKVHVLGSKWGHAGINIGKTRLITEDDAPSDAEHAQNDYHPIQQMEGLAYYVIEENGKPKLVRNTNYSKVPEASLPSELTS